MQQCVEVFRYGRVCLLNGARIAPPQPRSIEPACLRELRNLLLQQEILVPRSRSARIQNYRRPTFTRAINAQGTPADIDRSAFLRSTRLAICT
jgi:hypothetical protein